VLLYRAMACPYFYPVARFETSPWSVPPRLPLGDAFSGECRAPGNSAQPDEPRLREICNFGYGRGRCEQFPPASAADAVRFHVAKDAGQLIKIQYVFEKDCWPGEHGVLEYVHTDPEGAPERGRMSACTTLQRQADAYLESYLRRRNET
jgi:hypothetical protein